MDVLDDGEQVLRKQVAAQKESDDLHVKRLLRRCLAVLPNDSKSADSAAGKLRPIDLSQEIHITEDLANRRFVTPIVNLFAAGYPLAKICANGVSLGVAGTSGKDFALRQGAVRQLINSSVEVFAAEHGLFDDPALYGEPGRETAASRNLDLFLKDFIEAYPDPTEEDVRLFSHVFEKDFDFVKGRRG
ncbi:hypothetical protein ANO11243_051670 [Dothideomycetidae sp. 11243]|nr:hypothetical protein ANO11243_051670 [fungal sp. No.11243]